jgi:hypothetical protein
MRLAFWRAAGQAGGAAGDGTACAFGRSPSPHPNPAISICMLRSAGRCAAKLDIVPTVLALVASLAASAWSPRFVEARIWWMVARCILRPTGGATGTQRARWKPTSRTASWSATWP